MRLCRSRQLAAAQRRKEPQPRVFCDQKHFALGGRMSQGLGEATSFVGALLPETLALNRLLCQVAPRETAMTAEWFAQC